MFKREICKGELELFLSTGQQCSWTSEISFKSNVCIKYVQSWDLLRDKLRTCHIKVLSKDNVMSTNWINQNFLEKSAAKMDPRIEKGALLLAHGLGFSEEPLKGFSPSSLLQKGSHTVSGRVSVRKRDENT